jgi:hypothetical protein
MDISEMDISEIRYVHFRLYVHFYSYKMDISEMDISEMNLGAMAISDFRYIHNYKNENIGNRDIG